MSPEGPCPYLHGGASMSQREATIYHTMLRMKQFWATGFGKLWHGCWCSNKLPSNTHETLHCTLLRAWLNQWASVRPNKIMIRRLLRWVRHWLNRAITRSRLNDLASTVVYTVWSFEPRWMVDDCDTCAFHFQVNMFLEIRSTSWTSTRNSFAFVVLHPLSVWSSLLGVRLWIVCAVCSLTHK